MKVVPQHRHRRFSKVTDNEAYAASIDRIFGKKPAIGPRKKDAPKKRRGPGGFDETR